MHLINKITSATLIFPIYGSYKLLVSANDGHHKVSRELTIEVKKRGNQAPKITSMTVTPNSQVE